MDGIISKVLASILHRVVGGCEENLSMTLTGPTFAQGFVNVRDGRQPQRLFPAIHTPKGL